VGFRAQAASLTVGEYLERWLAEDVARRRPKTYVGYRDVVRLHITPVLGKKKLTRLSVQDVRLLVAHTEEKCVCCTQGTDKARVDRDRRCCAVGNCCQRRLSTRMVQFTHAVLRNALQHAVREELLARNVARLVQVSTPDYQVGRGLTVAEAHRVLAAAEEESLSALYVLALYLGLRRAELLGLRWSNVVLDPGEGRYPTLEVAETLQRVNGGLRFVPPKTRRSRRVVPLPPVCVDALRAHFDQQAAQRVGAGTEWREYGLVFPSRVGTPMEPDNLRRSWDRIKKAAGVALRLHDLRH
jgi:integrase